MKSTILPRIHFYILYFTNESNLVNFYSTKFLHPKFFKCHQLFDFTNPHLKVSIIITTNHLIWFTQLIFSMVIKFDIHLFFEIINIKYYLIIINK